MELLELLENNGLSIWVRESLSIFAYPSVLAMHTFGMAFLVGTSAGLALRMIGFAPDLPLGSLAGYFRLIWLGFWMCAFSGGVLLMQGATTFLTMPTFYIKLLAIAVAMNLVRALQRTISAAALGGAGAAAGTGTREATLGRAILGTWLIAITAGRVTAYSGWVGMQTAVAVLVAALALLIGGYVVVRLWPTAHPSASNGSAPRT
jgi:hypothetical protein